MSKNIKTSQFFLFTALVIMIILFIFTMVLYQTNIRTDTSSDFFKKGINTSSELKNIETKINSKQKLEEAPELEIKKVLKSTCESITKNIVYYKIPVDLSDILTNYDVYILLKKEYQNLPIEKLFVLGLDKLNHLVEIKKISDGTSNKVQYCSKDIFNSTATKFIIIHNHPGPDGLPIPSFADASSSKSMILRVRNERNKSIVNFGIWTEATLGAPKSEVISSVSWAEIDNWRAVNQNFCYWLYEREGLSCSSYNKVIQDDILSAIDAIQTDITKELIEEGKDVSDIFQS